MLYAALYPKGGDGPEVEAIDLDAGLEEKPVCGEISVLTAAVFVLLPLGCARFHSVQ